MPLPHYHLGSGLFLAVTLRRWLDPLILVAGTLAVDLEVPFFHLMGWGTETPRYGHTLLVGSGVGALCGLLLWCCWSPLQWVTRERMPARRPLVRAAASGVVGAWLHVFLDGMYRTGAGVFWPADLRNPLCRFGRGDAENVCLVLTLLALGPLVWRARRRA